LRHPAWVLFLEVQPNTVDVNVHPAKREVKLTHESEIFGFMVNAVQRALSKTQEIPTEFFEHSPLAAAMVPPAAAVREMYKPLINDSPISPRPTLPAVQLSAGGGLPLTAPLFRREALRAIAQVGSTYILAETSEGVVMIDQHAAAEKVIYEQLFKGLKTAAPATQMLLVPFSWEVSLSVAASLKERLADLAAFGFVIEPFGGNTYLVKGIPQSVNNKTDLPSLLDAISDAFSGTTQIQHRLAAATACKAAVKAGDSLELPECQGLLNDLATLEAPMTCPHGRPTMITLPFTDLNHRFRRT
jgi:DNA mismatch repair protein MutL